MPKAHPDYHHRRDAGYPSCGGVWGIRLTGSMRRWSKARTDLMSAFGTRPNFG
jgi:hypothetical protein